MAKQQDQKPKKEKPDDRAGLNIGGHLVIRDKNTGQELVRKRG